MGTKDNLSGEHDALLRAARAICSANAAAHSVKLFGAPADVRASVLREWREAMAALRGACGWEPSVAGEGDLADNVAAPTERLRAERDKARAEGERLRAALHQLVCAVHQRDSIDEYVIAAMHEGRRALGAE
jgi:hypothetical protein